MKVKVLFLVQLFFFSFTCVRSSRMLMVLPLGSRSHKHIFTPLAESLALNGHEVTVVSMYKEQGNRTLVYKDVAAFQAAEKVKSLTGDFNIFKMMKEGGNGNVNQEIMKVMIRNLPDFCEAFIMDPSVEEVWESKPDVILLPAFMNECGLIFVQKFKVPFIYVTTSGLTPWTSDLVGNPEHPAFVPNQYLPYTDDMTLFQRTVNSIFRILSPILRRQYILKPLNPVAQKFLKDSSISLAEIEKNVSLVFVNSHHSLGFPRPLQPNVIEVGGMHCQDPKSIEDKEISAFLNSSDPNSVIVFSLGSHIKSTQMPSNFKNMLVRAFSRIPYKVIWKWEGSPIQGLPSNILQKKWIPQQDVLGHPAVGGFFTHGGLLSTQEAVYHGVPVVGLPLISDQHLNMKQAETLGIAKTLRIQSITEDQIVEALTMIMEDPSFKIKAKERSEIMRDQETKPLERAAYYTEYVVRHQGAKHLRSASASLSNISYYLLDVIALIASISLLLLISLYFTITFTYKQVKKLISKKSSQMRSYITLPSDHTHSKPDINQSE